MASRFLAVTFAVLGQLASAGEFEDKADDVNVYDFTKGCCFKIGYGSMMKPCCLTRQNLDWKECFAPAFGGLSVPGPSATGGLDVGVGTTVGGDKGWRQNCPSTAAEASEIIRADKAKPNPFAAAAADGTFQEVQTDAGNSSLMSFIAQEVKEAHVMHKGLPWWGWVVTGGALFAAVLAGLAQVISEGYSRRRRVSNVKRGTDVEIARRAIASAGLSTDADEAEAPVPTPPLQDLMAVPSMGWNTQQYAPIAVVPAPVAARGARQAFSAPAYPVQMLYSASAASVPRAPGYASSPTFTVAAPMLQPAVQSGGLSR